MPLRCTVSPFIDTIIGREGHWQSRVLRNDLNSSRISRPIRSLSGQLLKMRPLTRGSVRTISGNMSSLLYQRLTGGGKGIRTHDTEGRFLGPSSDYLPRNDWLSCLIGALLCQLGRGRGAPKGSCPAGWFTRRG